MMSKQTMIDNVRTAIIKNGRFELRINEQLKTRIALKAQTKGKSMSEYILDVVRTKIEEEEKLGFNDPYLQNKLKLFHGNYPELSTDNWRHYHHKITGQSTRLRPAGIIRSLIYHLFNRMKIEVDKENE